MMKTVVIPASFRLSDCSRIFSMAALAASARSVIFRPARPRRWSWKEWCWFRDSFPAAENRASCRLRRPRRAARPVGRSESSGGPALRRCRCGRPGSPLPAPAAADRSGCPRHFLQAFGQAVLKILERAGANCSICSATAPRRWLWPRISSAISRLRAREIRSAHRAPAQRVMQSRLGSFGGPGLLGLAEHAGNAQRRVQIRLSPPARRETRCP